MAHVERSPNGKYKCQQCKRKIRKGQYSISVVAPQLTAHRYPRTLWFHSTPCYSRAAGKHGIPRPEIRRDLSGFMRLPLQMRDALTSSLWPNQMSDKLKLRLQIRDKDGIPVPLSEIKRAQLKLECERRDLRRSERKVVMRERLTHFLLSVDCRLVNDALVHGFCRQEATQQSLTMPIYLRDIVRKYYPVVLWDPEDDDDDSSSDDYSSSDDSSCDDDLSDDEEQDD